MKFLFFSGIGRRVSWYIGTDVSEELAVSIISVIQELFSTLIGLPWRWRHRTSPRRTYHFTRCLSNWNLKMKIVFIRVVVQAGNASLGQQVNIVGNFKLFVPCILSTYGMKTNWCHYFIRILLDLYVFRAHRPIFRRVRTAVHTTIGSVSVPLCSRALYVEQSEQSGTDTEPMVV